MNGRVKDGLPQIARIVVLATVGCLVIAAGIYIAWRSFEAMVAPQYGLAVGAIAIVIGVVLVYNAVIDSSNNETQD